jgi:hypothetical protein
MKVNLIILMQFILINANNTENFKISKLKFKYKAKRK